MIKKTSRFLITGLIIAWLVDFLFYKKVFGIAFSVWIVIAIIGLFVTSYLEKVKPHRLSYPLAALSIGLSTASFIRAEPFTQTISALSSLAFLMLLAITFTNGNWPYFRLFDYIIQGFKWLGYLLAQSWGILFQSPKNVDSSTGQEQTSTEIPSSGRKSAWPVIRGILIALPIVLVLAAFLAEADPIFNQMLKDLLKFFKIENLVEYLFRLFYILCLAYVFIGVLAQAIHPKKQETRPQPNQPSFKKFLGFVETKIVLISINILFVAFLVVQFRYFFGGEANINAAGYTYSEYARRGFGEIITVAVLSFLIYYFFHSITRLEMNNQKHLFSFLSVFIFLQVLVMLASSYQRLMLYEQAYGFSRLRTYSHLFLPWLALLILAIMVLEILKRQGYLAFSVILVATGFVATCIVFNIDGFIARQNIQRATLSSREGYSLDFYYLSELSSDAAPEMITGYFSNNPATKDLLGANLSCRWNALKNQKPIPWESFNLSKLNEKILLETYAHEWNQYPVTLNNNEYQSFYQLYSVDIQGKSYNCPIYFDWREVR